MTSYQTVIEWYDPAGNRHAPGTVEQLDPTVVFDLDHLLRQETIIVVPDPEPVKPARGKNAAPQEE